MIDLHNGELSYTWEDEGIVFITSVLNAITLSMPRIEFLQFVSELNKAAVEATRLQQEEFKSNIKENQN